MQDNYKIWTDRAESLMIFGLLPLKWTIKSNPMIHLIGILVTIPWFVITLPIQLVLFMVASIFMMMAQRHNDE